MKDSTNSVKHGLIRHFAVTAALALGVGLLGASVAIAQTENDPADANMAPPDAAAQQQPASPSGVVNESQQQADEYKRTGQLPSAPANAQPQGQPPQGQYQGQGYPQGDQGYPPSDQGYGQPGAPYGDQGGPMMEDQVDAGQEALETSMAPPALPTYAQPMAPGPNYIWTPGYWYWGPAGYYWVPGAWVLAPYDGALWTPGYWGFIGGRYRWNHGYWGLHIGYYGGINYGFGYTGMGYYGGYWNGGNFFYNTYFSRVNTARIRNVYSRARVVDNTSRVSFNGGHSGIQARPQAREMSAMREGRSPAMSSQVKERSNASLNRSQYYSAERSRPATTATSRALPADRGVTRPQMQSRPAAQPHFAPQSRPAAPQIRSGGNRR